MRAAGSFAWLTTTEAPAHEELGLATEDFGIIFAYPWPDEERALGQLFERHAGAGALLIGCRTRSNQPGATNQEGPAAGGAGPPDRRAEHISAGGVAAFKLTEHQTSAS